MEIQVDNISFSYDTRPVIKELTCQFKPGKIYAILGPNGSGKTTLLDLVSGFLPPEKGRVLVNGGPASALSRQEMARIISLVSQNYDINFPFRVDEVVMMGRHPHIGRFAHPSPSDWRFVAQVMDDTGISHLKHRKMTELSGGEKQRCIVARSLCQDTPVLLLDEAFSNMDINHTLSMLGVMKKSVCQGDKSIVAVLHDLNLAAAWADQLLFLKNGIIRASGPTREVLTEENIEKVFKVKAKVEFNDYVQARQVYFKKI